MTQAVHERPPLEDVTVPRDQEVDLSFSGFLLGSSSSQTPRTTRWSELDVWRTQGGSYVLANVGRSRMRVCQACEDRSSDAWQQRTPLARCHECNQTGDGDACGLCGASPLDTCVTCGAVTQRERNWRNAQVFADPADLVAAMHRLQHVCLGQWRCTRCEKTLNTARCGECAKSHVVKVREGCGWETKSTFCKRCRMHTTPTNPPQYRLTNAARDALEQAAAWDDGVDRALEARLVEVIA